MLGFEWPSSTTTERPKVIKADCQFMLWASKRVSSQPHELQTSLSLSHIRTHTNTSTRVHGEDPLCGTVWRPDSGVP